MKARAVPLILLLVAGTATAADKNEVIAKTFPTAAGKVVLVDAGALDVSVRSADIPDIRVRVELGAAAFKETQAKAWIESHRPTFDDTAGQLKIVAPDPGGVNLFKGVVISKAHMELVLPLAVRPDLSTSSATMRVEGEFAAGNPLRLRSASGDIELLGWAPEVEVRTTSGNITIRATRAIERLLARTSSGAVSLTGGARAVRCDSSSGAVALGGLLGPTTVMTTSGGVTLGFDALAADAEVKITTASGRVRVTLPPGTQPGGELSSVRGEIRSVYPGAAPANEPRLVLSGTAPKITVTTTSGKIELL
jgi:DUF4097 and DUF4098 domain-containing protein YvlB